MDHFRDQQEPLEAGEDGTFDLGDGTQPVLPAKPIDIARKKNQDISSPPPAETQPCGSPPIKDDWEKVDLGMGDEGLPHPVGCASQGREAEAPPPAPENLSAPEDFQDAVETLKPQGKSDQQTGTEAGCKGSCTESVVNDAGGAKGAECAEIIAHGQAAPVVAEGSSSPRPPAVEQRPQGDADGANVIASGLANVRLPMGCGRRSRPGADTPEGLYDSDEEEEFHDARDSGPGVVKDATKAREMKETGNTHYKNGEFEDAIDYYTMALHYCPEDEEHRKDRAVYLANRAQGHLRLEEYETVVEDCTAALEADPTYVKALLRRAQANEHLEKYDLALEDAKALLEIDPGLRLAKESMPRLEKLQNDKNEKMKEEAIGKLKDLGNAILGNFGLSTDNFKMKQDPETGSYSINFER